jgi:FtsZ-interacting cell division protein ZipA
MEIAIILMFVIIFALFITGMLINRKERIKERDEMFYEGEVKFGENPDGSKVAPSNSIDVVDELSKTLTNELEKVTKTRKKKPAKKKKPEFPIEPAIIKPKAKRGRKPKNKDKKGGDDMLLS